MDLGSFSISLAVQDLAASRAFYEKLGFAVTGGDEAQHWLVLRNGDRVIGLFQGMFDRNMLTFNPGWNQQAGETEEYTDIREIAAALREGGVELINPTNLDGEGPAHFVLIDPDGNPVLVDQHR